MNHKIFIQQIQNRDTSLVVQWLRLSASNARGMGSIPGQGTKIPHAMWHSQNKQTKNVYNINREREYTEFSPYGDREEENEDGKKEQKRRKGKEEKM